MQMKITNHILFCLSIVGFVFLAESCGCRSKNSKEKEAEAELESYLQSYPRQTFVEKQIDSIVHLSFLGFALGENIHSLVKNPKVTYQSTVTEESVKIYEVPKMIAFGKYTSTIPVEIYSINDTICKIHGKILDDVTKVVFDTYAAKYGEPTSGKIEEEYNDGFASASWKYLNQEINLYRTADKRINMGARPIYEYYAFRDIDIYYEDFALFKHYCSVNNIQIEYDKKMKPIRDSIEAVRKQATDDSLKAVKRNELLRNAPQI